MQAGRTASAAMHINKAAIIVMIGEAGKNRRTHIDSRCFG
jgi:hypothetical protein